MNLRDFFKHLEQQVEQQLIAAEHISFLRAAAKQAIHNGLTVAFAEGNSGTPEAVIITDVNKLITTTTSNLGPIVSGIAGLGEVGIDNAIQAAFTHYGSTVSEQDLENYIFSHLGLNVN